MVAGDERERDVAVGAPRPVGDALRHRLPHRVEEVAGAAELEEPAEVHRGEIGEPDPGPQRLLGGVGGTFVDLPRAAHALELVGGLVQAARGEQGSGVRELERCEQLGEAEPHRRGVVVEREPAGVGAAAHRVDDRARELLDPGIGVVPHRRVQVVARQLGRRALRVRREDVRVVVAADDQGGGALERGAPVVGGEHPRPARVEHVPAGEQVEGVESLPLHLRLDLGDALAAHAGEIELVDHRRRC